MYRYVINIGHSYPITAVNAYITGLLIEVHNLNFRYIPILQSFVLKMIYIEICASLIIVLSISVGRSSFTKSLPYLPPWAST